MIALALAVAQTSVTLIAKPVPITLPVVEYVTHVRGGLVEFE